MTVAVDVLAVGPHPDDVELGAGGTVAKLARAGRRVAILHLTCGEAGTRGSVAERRREAERAAERLGAASVEFLALGDGGLRIGREEEELVIAALRRLRPELVLGPAPEDRHPDHGRAHRLLRAACFYAGLAKRGAAPPHRPAALFSYLQHDAVFAPSFVVDVTADWATKQAALDAYESQIHRLGAEPSAGPSTVTASRRFRLAVEGRARHFGQLVGAELGEPFWSPTPLAVPDPWQLLPAGLR
ncbi:MAG TPA: bacillithiol biosynthesis deacetylase BshB1 [Thermoanaerobaculia bacterium]|jgi:bacillithiol biosynthesis deacetylase BshB1